MTPLLRKLIAILEEHERATWHEYTVPGLWVGSHANVTFPTGASYILHQLSRLQAWRKRRVSGAPWSLSSALAYNVMVRHVSSFDHGVNVELDGWRRTGTFIKLLALLPYLKGLGVDTLILMPITDIGETGRKGSLGSPYAVRHPFRIDPLLAEPCLDMTVDDQARVLIETCHLLGMKVVLETVLRTASIDSDLVPVHPEWFYWVDEGLLGGDATSFTSPSFTNEQLLEMKGKIDEGIMTALPVPSEDYQKLFDFMPMRIERDEHGWMGIAAREKILRIAGAFADWPPDDPQPAWSDVTYLRLHDHPAYRYMAYNTIRMFERELDQSLYRQSSLWNTIAGVIPHYIRLFGIDGAMIDMGHALPTELRIRVVNECRTLKPDFILLEENFQLEAASSSTGYDAVIGYLPFDAHHVEKLKTFVGRVATNDIPVRFFASPESHNTPRVAARLAGHTGLAIWIGLFLLPHSFGFMHAGMELLEHRPVNTGLGFTEEEIAEFPTESLALFADVPLPWKDGMDSSTWLRKKLENIRALDVYRMLTDDDILLLVEIDDSNIIAYQRIPPKSSRGLLVIINTLDVARTILISRDKISNVMFIGVMQGVHQRTDEVMIDVGAGDCVVLPTLITSTIA